tara:strand:+ start:268 stop:540 length:273 start_codon:yes stop_codon:yes gene_type:complete
MKNTIRFGVAGLPGEAIKLSRPSETPNAAPVLAAIPCSILLRLNMIVLFLGKDGRLSEFGVDLSKQFDPNRPIFKNSYTRSSGIGDGWRS